MKLPRWAKFDKNLLFKLQLHFIRGFTFNAKYLDVRKNSEVEGRELPVEEGEAVASQAEVEVVNQLLPTFVPSIWSQNMEF